jgi:hypothetical protein
VAAEVAWKQGHVVEVLRWRQIWLDQADAEVGASSSSSSSSSSSADWYHLPLYEVVRCKQIWLNQADAEVGASSSSDWYHYITFIFHAPLIKEKADGISPFCV